MKMNKVTFVIISTICLFTFFSCSFSLLTDPLPMPKALKDLAPDVAGDDDATDEQRITVMADALAAESTDDLMSAAGESSTASDPVLSAAILTALGSRTNEISSMSQSNKIQILTLTTNAVLPIKTLMGAAGTAMNSINSNSNNNNNGSSSSGNSGENSDSDAMLGSIITSVFGETIHVDTSITEEVLKDMMSESAGAIQFTTTYNEENGRDEVVVDDTVVNVLLSTVSVAVSSLKTAPDPIELVEDETDENGDIVYGEDGQPNKVPSADLKSAIEELIEYFKNGFNEGGDLHCLIEENATEAQKEEAMDEAAEAVLGALDRNGVASPVGKESLKTVFKTLAWLWSKNINIDSLSAKFSSMMGGSNS